MCFFSPQLQTIYHGRKSTGWISTQNRTWFTAYVQKTQYILLKMHSVLSQHIQPQHAFRWVSDKGQPIIVMMLPTNCHWPLETDICLPHYVKTDGFSCGKQHEELSAPDVRGRDCFSYRDGLPGASQKRIKSVFVWKCERGETSEIHPPVNHCYF